MTIDIQFIIGVLELHEIGHPHPFLTIDIHGFPLPNPDDNFTIEGQYRTAKIINSAGKRQVISLPPEVIAVVREV